MVNGRRRQGIPVKYVPAANYCSAGLIILCAILFLFFLTPSARGAEGDITINYPPDGTVMEFDTLSVSLTVTPGTFSSLTIYVNSDKKMEIVPERAFESFSVILDTGMNVIEIAGTKNDQLIDKKSIRVFRRSDLQRIYQTPPEGFQKDYFHGKDRSLCRPCHILQPGENDKKPVTVSAFPAEAVKGLSASEAAKSTCYSCHKSLTARPFIHGPSAVWSCLSCHEPQSEPKYSVKKPDTKLCFGCHLVQKEKWYSKKYLHGPFNTGKCAICHSPHASDYPYNLVRDTWDLCVGCHTDKGSGLHIVQKFFSATYHPTRGKPDPSRKGQELTCASCHDPHAANNNKLWRFNVSSDFQLCMQCHGG